MPVRVCRLARFLSCGVCQLAQGMLLARLNEIPGFAKQGRLTPQQLAATRWTVKTMKHCSDAGCSVCAVPAAASASASAAASASASVSASASASAAASESASAASAPAAAPAAATESASASASASDSASKRARDDTTDPFQFERARCIAHSVFAPLAFRVHAACRSLRMSTRKKTRTRQ